MNTRTTTRRARGLAGLAAAGACVGALLVPSLATPVDAARRTTESAAVADSAIRALEALDRWHEHGHAADLAAFRSSRDQAASLIATDLDVSGDALVDEWRAAHEGKQIAMLSALTQLGVPYRSLASKPGEGFDCSGLTTWAFREAGVELPRISRDQIRAADDIEIDEAEPGDLTYYPGHVSIYIGQGLMVHSPNSGNRVEVRALPERSNDFGDAFVDGLVVEDAAGPAHEAARHARSRRLARHYWSTD